MTETIFRRFAPAPTRRIVVAGLAATIGAAASALPAHAQRNGPDSVPVAELMKATPLKDIAVGKADAKVVIVEYASLTCPHCAAFHNSIYPQLKTKYLDTGKARLVFRDFPLDERAEAGAMLARCVPSEAGSAAMISELFKRQNEWAFVQPNIVVTRLFEIAKQAGFTQASFEKCLTDQKLYENLQAERKRASEKFGVSSTPTFFINGKRLRGGSLADFEKAIDPLLKE